MGDTQAQAPEANANTTTTPEVAATPTPNDVATAEAALKEARQASNTADAPAETETFDRAYVEKLRKESADYRTRAKAEAEKAAAEKQDLINQLGKALGFVNDEEPADQAKLIEQATQERDKYQAELANLREENTLNAAASKANADASLLIPYLRGSGKLAELDTTADDYVSQVEQLVAETVGANQKFKHNTLAASGVDTTNTTHNPNATLNAADLNRMYANGEHEAINKAFAEGRFNL